jgi:hypothetical protein
MHALELAAGWAAVVNSAQFLSRLPTTVFCSPRRRLYGKASTPCNRSKAKVAPKYLAKCKSESPANGNHAGSAERIAGTYDDDGRSTGTFQNY